MYFSLIVANHFNQFFLADNSLADVSFWVKPAIKKIETFKFQIGATKINYFAQDASKNVANCNFTITVIGEFHLIVKFPY